MACDIFKSTEITGECLAESTCRDNCAIFDPTGRTSKAEVLKILQNKKWGQQQLNKFYDKLEAHRDKLQAQASVVVMQA